MWGVMLIEKLRQNAQREAAALQAREEARTAQRRSKRRILRSVIPPGLVQHPMFVWILAIWGAALAGLSVMMLPGFTIARLSMFAGLGALGDLARVVFALVAGLAGAGLGFTLAAALRRLMARGLSPSPIASMAGRRVRPINPAAELGSASLDAPIEQMPFGGGAPDGGGADEEMAPDEVLELHEPLEVHQALAEEPLEGDDPALHADSGPGAPAQEGETAVDDDALDLAGFAALEAEDDNDEQPPVQQVGERTGEAADASDPPLPAASSGIEQLRRVPPRELSLVQLVERFAAALHDLQDTSPRAVMPPVRSVGETGRETGREAALAEALKALALFSEGGFDVPSTAPQAQSRKTSENSIAGQPARFGASFGGQASSAGTDATERDLREALERLRNLRGAA